MDPATKRFYDNYAEEVIAGTEARRSAVSQYFSEAFPARSTILDVGSGSGRDMAVLLQSGHNVFGVEPNAAMREAAKRVYPQLKEKLIDAALPDIGAPFGGRFDGVLCSAVLMHVRGDELKRALSSMLTVLKPAGRMLVSLPTLHRPPVDGRDSSERLFENHTADLVLFLIESLGARQLSHWDSLPNLTGPETTTWHTSLFQAGGSRSTC